MKIMEVSIEEKDCTLEMVTPPRKKMKQAQLPFQMVSPLGSSNSITNKKRKLESPSPVESKSPTTGRIVKKRNVAKRAKSSDIEVIELDIPESENDADDRENKKVVNDRARDEDSKESNEEKAIGKQGEKMPKESETPAKKKKDYGVLDMFLKKAHSKEAKDDIQLLAMSDYESGNSKDSDGSIKSKTDSNQTVKEASERGSENLDGKNEDKVDIDSKKVIDNENEEKLDEDEKQGNLNDEEKSTEALAETKNSDTNSSVSKKGSVASDNEDAKSGESDSDIGILSSDEDADDEPDKSSNENGDRDKTFDESDGGKTPRDGRSSLLKNRKLTPKQVERRLQSAKKREERQQLKIEKEKKREEERENRRKEKEEKRREKEEKEKLDKEQKRKEREMKELKKQMEIEQKQKEKEAKEEERKKKEEEKLEMERKKQKAASNFANFFVAKKQETKATEEDNVVKGQNFMPFEMKLDMRVAPITRRNLNDENKLTFEGLFNKGITEKELYLNELKRNRENVGRSPKTWPWEAKDDVIIVDEADSSSDAVAPVSAPVSEKHHPKLFLFAENRRPPFWGTWRKKSDHIRPRRPFAKDSKWFDYDVDSDDEWEEEEPGESIRGSDDERDDEGPEENEYDVDNDFMVPHGYLSDEEAKADEEDGEDMSPETQKLKLKLLGEEFEAARKTKTSKIKPKVIGCVWQGLENAYPKNTSPHVQQILDAHRAWLSDVPIVFTATSISENALPSGLTECGSPVTPSVGAKKKRVPEEAMPNLIRLVHGNINGRIFLVKEFIAFWEKNKTGDRQISKLSLSQKIREIASWMACPEEGPMHTRSCWYVREDIREKYNCLDVGIPNRWEYVLQPTRRSDVGVVESPERVEKEKKRIPLITQFTKKITQEEKLKQLACSKPAPSLSKPPKRVALISVPRGEQFNSPSVFFSSDNGSAKTTVTKTARGDQNPDANLPKAEPKNSDVNSQLENAGKDSEIREEARLEPAAVDTGEVDTIVLD